MSLPSKVLYTKSADRTSSGGYVLMLWERWKMSERGFDAESSRNLNYTSPNAYFSAHMSLKRGDTYTL